MPNTGNDKLSSLCESLHLRIVDDRPVLESTLSHERELAVPQEQQILNFTRSLIAISEQTPERFCPNSHLFFKRYCDDCKITYIMSIGCHQRTCSFCAAKREAKLIWEYQDACNIMQNPKLITLTAPWFKNPRVGTKIMRASFRKLRRRMPFKYLFKMGIYGFHCEPRPGGMWFIHIHALVDTKYIPQDILSRVWSKCLPGAVVTDIRKAWSPKGGLKYILGYITATKHLSGHEDEFNSEMDGTHLVSTMGDMHATPMQHGPFICPHCGTELYANAHSSVGPILYHNYNRRRFRTAQQLTLT